jgi:hypothetical protein
MDVPNENTAHAADAEYTSNAGVRAKSVILRFCGATVQLARTLRFLAPILAPPRAMAAAADPETYGPRPGIIAPLPSAERGVAVVTATSPCGRYFLYANGTNVVVRDLHVRREMGEI